MLHPLIVYLAVSVVFCAMTGLGTLPARFLEREDQPSRLLRVPLLAISGWGLVALISALGAVADMGQAWLARALVVLGLLLLVPLRGATHARQIQLLGDLIMLLALVAPMGLLVAATPAAAFDEFAHWLPNTRYLVEHARYWGWPDWLSLSSKPGYPNGSLVVALLVSQITGPEVEAPFKTFVVILLGCYGAVLADLAASRWPPDPARPGVARLAVAGLLAAGCLIAFLDPFVDPRISLTAYTDTSSATVLAIAAVVACRGLMPARCGEHRAATGWFARTGLLLLALVLLRTTNMVLIAALGLACAMLLLIGKSGSPRWRARWAALLTGPAVVGAFVWQSHLWLARIGPDMAPRPFGLWDWTAPVTVAGVFFLDRLRDNPLIGGAAIGLVILGIAGGVLALRRSDDDGHAALPSPRLMVALTATVVACFVVFLAWTYIAVFSSLEVASAVSLWRYLTELGPLIVVTGICVVLGLIPQRRLGGRLAIWAVGVAVGLFVLLPFVGRSYYSLDCRFPDIAAARAAIAQFRPALEPFGGPAPHPARVAVVNPTVGDWMAYALAFDMRWPAAADLVRFRVKDEALADSEDWAWDQGLDALLDFTPLDRQSLRSRASIPSVALLGRPAEKGAGWPVLATTQPRPLPSCSVWHR